MKNGTVNDSPALWPFHAQALTAFPGSFAAAGTSARQLHLSEACPKDCYRLSWPAPPIFQKKARHIREAQSQNRASILRQFPKRRFSRRFAKRRFFPKSFIKKFFLNFAPFPRPFSKKATALGMRSKACKVPAHKMGHSAVRGSNPSARAASCCLHAGPARAPFSEHTCHPAPCQPPNPYDIYSCY